MVSPDILREQKRRNRHPNIGGYVAAVLGVAMGGLVALRMVNPSAGSGPESVVQKPNVTSSDTNPDTQGTVPSELIDPRAPTPEYLRTALKPLEPRLRNSRGDKLTLRDCSDVRTNHEGFFYPGVVAVANPKTGAPLTSLLGSQGEKIGPGIPGSDYVYFTAFLVENNFGSIIRTAISPNPIDRAIDELKGLYFAEIDSSSGNRTSRYRLSLTGDGDKLCKDADWGSAPLVPVPTLK